MSRILKIFSVLGAEFVVFVLGIALAMAGAWCMGGTGVSFLMGGGILLADVFVGRWMQFKLDLKKREGDR